jgi:hypothetical protein
MFEQRSTPLFCTGHRCVKDCEGSLLYRRCACACVTTVYVARFTILHSDCHGMRPIP